MSNKNIVIVEDENLVARDLQTSLEQWGYTEDPMVPSGEQAIREIEEKQSDMVLMDIVLQGEMDGMGDCHMYVQANTIFAFFLLILIIT